MQIRTATRITALFSIFLLLFSTVLPATAALHPLSMLQHNRTTGVSDIDLTISLDWDPTTVNQSVTPRGMTVAETEAAVRSFAASLYGMTNGLHRLRTIYIHTKRKSWDTADIRYIGTKAGRSNASVAAWQVPKQQVTMYVYETQTETDDYPGPVMAHEMGHYLYGIFDEYREQPGADAYTIAELLQKGWLDDPATDDDGTQLSIMNQHWEYPNWFSHNGGYVGPAARLNTAQYRAYGKSIWDTLSSAPSGDPEYARRYNRKQFEAFIGTRITSAADLKAAQKGTMSGYDNALNIVWVDAPVLNLVLLDSAIPASRWAEARAGAADLARNLPAGGYLQVQSGSSTGLNRDLISEANRATRANQAGQLQQSSVVGLEDALAAALVQVRAYRATLSYNQVTTLYLITTANPTVSASLIEELKQLNVAARVYFLAPLAGTTAAKASIRPAPKPVKASTEAAAGEQIYLSQLSRETGGSFSTINSGGELTTELFAAANESDGYGLALLGSADAPRLAAGQRLEMRFTVGAHDPLPMIIMEAAPSEMARLTPSLIDPGGKIITAATTGVIFEADADNGGWLWMLDPDQYAGGYGVWTAVLTAKEAVSDDLGMLAAGISPLLLQLDVVQRPVSGNLLEVSLKQERPVLQARVRADISDESGTKVRTGLVLVDDGKNGDLRPNDGVYTVALHDLVPGEYSFRVVADDNNGNAIASDRGTLFNPRKSATPDEATGPFQRIDEETFTVAAATPVPAGGDGGGCAVGSGDSRDLLLVLSLVFPLLCLLMPRRRQQQAVYKPKNGL